MSGSAVRTVLPSAGWVERSAAPTSATAAAPPVEVPIILTASTNTFGLFASFADAFGINEHRERVPKFFHDRPRDLVLRFPAIIEADDRASRRYIFLATPPRQQILHADYGNPGIFELFHLRLEIGRCDLGARIANFVDQAVITKDDGLRRLIDNGFGNFWRRSSWANGSRCRR